MERVAFIVDATGERIDCLLNPATFEMSRLAGVRARGSAGGRLVGAAQTDDPLVFTGGGRTDLLLDLVVDVDLVETAAPPTDVRTISSRLWRLSENTGRELGAHRPPLVRMVWGKSWNVPGVVVAIAERFDAFDPTGIPRRSWLRMKLARVTEPVTARGGYEDDLVASAEAPAVRTAAAVRAVGDGEPAGGFSGVRLDLLADEALGNPFRWRDLAEHNDIADPFDVPAGTALAVPDPTPGSRP
jgi:hypothetical protein